MIWGGNCHPKSVFIADSSGFLNFIDCYSEELLVKQQISSSWVNTLAIEPKDERLLAAGTLNSKVDILRVDPLSPNEEDLLVPLHQFVGHRGAVRSLKFLSKNFLISGSTDSCIGLWDINNTHRYLAMIEGHMNEIVSVDVCSNDRNIFISGGSDLTTKIWDIRLKKPEVFSFTGSKSSINCVKFLPNFITTFASGADDSTILLYDLRAGRYIHVFNDSTSYDPIKKFAFSRSGRLIFAACGGKQLKVYDTLDDSGGLFNKVSLGMEDSVASFDLSAEGGSIAAVDRKGNLSVVMKDISLISEMDGDE